ncbi:PHP domain-containing protein [Aeromicrobium senzhongii]|uniref:PHP domain-containing protein n=1 Tax=Aeromicrobium senzhongii TaxID=2663859 RepID=A0ABX6ST44_9ACTN|nr:PHP domain-containing protein [Aeromicrobium senzhongii]MTB88973.1 PHP domain-containing protein [Aeromicrobium senzhongii]QNL93747.1 PHP domain-containing protein [Aeromicrobium senzhongii]
MRIDLHTHSTRSDGTDTPAELVRKAKLEGLDVVALTDHDATEGWAEAQEAADEVGLRLIRGIEISTQYEGLSVHLLGYEFDPQNEPLVEELHRVLGGRNDRLPRLLDKLAALGMPLTEQEVLAVAGDAAAWGRPHVADAMIAKGYIKDRDEAFRDWLVPGKPAYVGRYSADLFEAVRLLREAGGKPVIAHAWARDSGTKITPELLAKLAETGLAGVEVDHPDHDARARAGLAAIADDLGLAKTGASDYHGTGKGPAFHLGANLTDPAELERLLG